MLNCGKKKGDILIICRILQFIYRPQNVHRIFQCCHRMFIEYFSVAIEFKCFQRNVMSSEFYRSINQLWNRLESSSLDFYPLLAPEIKFNHSFIHYSYILWSHSNHGKIIYLYGYHVSNYDQLEILYICIYCYCNILMCQLLI